MKSVLQKQWRKERKGEKIPYLSLEYKELELGVLGLCEMELVSDWKLLRSFALEE